MKNKILSILLLCGMLLTSAACAADTSSGADDTTASDTTETTAETTVDDGLDQVPEMTFDGYNFRVWSIVTDFYHGEIKTTETTGDVFNDARYEYARAVEERFDITITETTSNDVKDPKTVLLAGEDAYDMLNNGSSKVIEYAKESLCYIIDDLPYVDLDRPYWNKELNDSLAINNVNYFAIAPFNLQTYDFAHALIFNKEMMNSYELGDMYSIVNDGKWTLEEFERMTTAVTYDLNGDGQFNGDDQYGFLAQPKAVLPGFWIASGETTIKKDSDGALYFALPGNERFVNLIEHIFAITWDNGTWFVNQSTTNHDDLLRNKFKNNQGLFFDTQFYHIEALRDMDTDFGVIPYPKYDEAQDKYYSRFETAYTFCVPVTNTELERTSAIIEVLACEAARTVIPAYYDVSLKVKLTRDDASSEMLDLIFDGLTVDYGDTVWCADIRDGIFRLMFLNNKREIASDIASIEEKIDILLTETVDAYRKLEK